VLGKGRALDCSAVFTWAGERSGRAERIRAAVAATIGVAKLVPTEMLKLSV
jgi:hypothetical protein